MFRKIRQEIIAQQHGDLDELMPVNMWTVARLWKKWVLQDSCTLVVLYRQDWLHNCI